MVANDTLQARAIGSFAATQLGANRYAALDDGTPYGKGLADGAAAQLKAEKKEVVVRKSFDDKTVAFDELAGELKAANVEVIVSTLNDFQALALLESLRKVGHTKVSLLGGDTIKTTDMTKGTGIVQGLYATSPVLEAKEFTTGKTFLEKYIAAFKKPPAYGGHYSYDSTYVLSAAIQKAKSADPKDITKPLAQHQRLRPGDRHHDLGRQGRAALRRRGRVRAAQRQLGAADAVGPLVNSPARTDQPRVLHSGHEFADPGY